ncbi:MAG: GNAT family N-acetyltransferase, partial [Pseudomonadota bacterium]|nr:GNAT family N-acetyltransferase [Pseudomonadota bacterium]
ARAEGLETVKLYTNVKMQANLTLYPRLGYVETARKSEDGFDRVYFEKRL